ncbi:phospholipid carrier-dependent glycosyltransferase [Nannocystaceae bacterium ST9]
MAEPDRPTARALPWLAALLVLATLTLLRVIALDRDPPTIVLPHYADEAHFRDEVAKAHEARNMARFDRWQLSDADEYGFWRLQSPYWVYAEAAWFRVFGVDLVSARAFVLVHVLLSLALLFWLALVRHGLPAAIATTLLLGANWAFLVFSRLALMEGVVIAWLLVASAGLAQLERRPDQPARWIAVAVLGLLLACTTKQTALLVIPAFVPILIALSLRAAGPGSLAGRLRRPAPAWALLGVLVLLGVLAALLLDPEYQRRLAFNARHFTSAEERGSSVVGNAALSLVYGLFGRRMQLMFMVLAPLPLWLATVELGRWLVASWQRRRRGERSSTPLGLEGGLTIFDIWMLAWALLALLANLASPHRAVRFQLVLIPPAAWLGGLLVARAWLHAWPSVRATRAVRAGLLALLLASGSVTLVRFGLWLAESESSAAELGGELEAMIGDRHAVVVGEFAAQAVFATDYWHFYVRPGQFNDTREIIGALAITHLIEVTDEEDFVARLLARRAPKLLAGRVQIGTLRFREHELIVWELQPAARSPE